MLKRIFCIDCAARAPDSNTSYTVIDAGWRLSRKHGPNGVIVEWRCQECFRKRKSADSGAPGSSPPSGPRTPPRNQ